MAITFISLTKDPTPWLTSLKNTAPELDIRVWPDDNPREDVQFALTWNTPQGIWSSYPNLKGITSLGAGADHLLADVTLPEDIPLARVVDPGLVQSMVEYVLYCTLDGFRNFGIYRNQQKHVRWHPLAPGDINNWTVGILGAGQLGLASARALKSIGFDVRLWGRTPKSNTENYFHGNSSLPAFCSPCRTLICLLPLTPGTIGILNKDLFRLLPTDAQLVNVARGSHLVEDDLLEALHSEQLACAYLDVFDKEPLPVAHSFWKHPKIHITPHIASITNPVTAAKQIIENYYRLLENLPMKNSVDRERGY